MDLRHFLFRHRSYTPLPLLLVSVIFANPTVISLSIGALIALFGEGIRLWGVANAGPTTRTTDAPGGDYLVTTGAFGYVRNPIYIGNIIMYTGVGVMTGVLWLPLVSFIYFFAQYALIISAEEQFLKSRYGEEYLRYSHNVRRFIPRLSAYPSSSPATSHFNLAKGLRSEARTFQAITACIILMSALAYFKS